MITSFDTSVKVSLEFANREELSEFYCMLNSACVALQQKAEKIDDEYYQNRSLEFFKFVDKFNPVSIFGKYAG